MKLQFSLYLFCNFLSRLLTCKQAYQVSKFIAACCWAFKLDERHGVQRNIGMIRGLSHGSKEVKGLTYKLYQDFGRQCVDTLYDTCLEPELLKRKFYFEGSEHLRHAKALKRGIVFLSAHIGHWELGVMGLTLHGDQVNVLAYRHPNVRVNDLLLSRRSRYGVATLPEQGSSKSCLKLLRAGGAVGLMADRTYVSQERRQHMFFKRPANLPRSAALLSQRAKAPIVPVTCIKNGITQRYCVTFHPPLIPQKNERHRSIAKYQKKVLFRIEKLILNNRQQWYSFICPWPKP